MTQTIRRIDHLVVPVEDPDDLFDLFTQRLGLPALWPVSDVGPFRSAGVAAGTCWIEIVADAEGLAPQYAAALPATFRGIAFTANGSCQDGAAALDAAGIPRDEIRVVEGRRPDGVDGPMVTIVPIPDLIGDAGIAYLCEMAAPVDAQRVADRTTKAADRDGSIGIRGLAEIHIGARDLAAAAIAWSRIAGPGDDHVWRIGDGPAVRVDGSPLDGITGVTMTVASLPHATDALRERGLLGAVRSSGVGVNHAAAHGLDIWLVEAPPA